MQYTETNSRCTLGSLPGNPSPNTLARIHFGMSNQEEILVLHPLTLQNKERPHVKMELLNPETGKKSFKT